MQASEGRCPTRTKPRECTNGSYWSWIGAARLDPAVLRNCGGWGPLPAPAVAERFQEQNSKDC